MNDTALYNTRQVIVRLLNNIGSNREVDQYLKQYASLESQKFAIIKVGGAILSEKLPELASALSFLHLVGLTPIVVHGAGPQLNAALDEEGIPTRRVDGMRITTPEVLKVARRVFQHENLKLVDALEQLGTRARPIFTGVLEAEPMDSKHLGLVGKVTKVHLDALRSCVRAGYLPIVSCLGETPSGQFLNINADVAAREMALRIEPFKIIFLTITGGLLDRDGQLLPAVNLVEDYEHLMAQDWVHSGMRLKLRENKTLLHKLPLESSVSITSPGLLARELFTYRGSGTLIRRGEKVHRFSSLQPIDLPRLRTLLETCFTKRLAPDYFAQKAFLRIYVTNNYRGTAILTQEEGIPYLDKFAVTNKAQGEGMGGSLWTRISSENPKLFWRARVGNQINSWYFRNAEGSFRQGQWIVFWYGLEGFDEIKLCIDRALSIPSTLEPFAQETR